MSQYGDPADLAKWGLPARLLAGFSTDEQAAHLQSASALFDSYAMHRGYVVPLASWGPELTASVCRVAAWTLLNFRGANPENPADQGVAKAHDDAIAWWRDISRGAANLVAVTTTPARKLTGVASVFSSTPDDDGSTRGW